MRAMRNPIIGAIIAGSLFFSSTGAVAATTAIPQVNPWAALSAMSGGAPAAALCGAAAVAAAGQTAPANCVLPVADAAPVAAQEPPTPVPVPPVEPVGGGFGVNPLLLALGAVAAGGLLYLLLHNNNNDNNDNENSPS